MTVSTDGQICYGIRFEEGFVFPWSDEDENGDPTGWDGEEDWWLKGALGWKPTVQVYDEEGQYLPGFNDKSPETKAHFDEYYAFLKAHPFPVAVVNYCSGDYPMYILAVPSSCKSNGRGFPEVFDPADLTVTAEERQTLLDFCNKYGIDIGDEAPRWWLSSYWG